MDNLKKIWLGLAICMAAVLVVGCPRAHNIATTTTAGVMHATQITSKSLAAMDTVNHNKCLAAHGAKSVMYANCIRPVRKRLVAYRDNARPAARSAVGASYAGIRIAQAAKKDYSAYIAVLKPGGCALVLCLREWGHKLPDKGAAILPLLPFFTGLVCDKPEAAAATAAAIVIALLPVAVDLVKWVVQLLGASNDDLLKSISAWIQASPKDEVDALIEKIDAALPGAP